MIESMPVQGEETTQKGTRSISQKMVQVRRECVGILKMKHGKGVPYAYATLGDVFEKIYPKMNELEIDFTMDETNASVRESGKNWIYESDLLLTFTDCESGEHIDSRLHIVGMNNDPAKAKGCAYTYGIKYFCFNRFLIDLDEYDPDAKPQTGYIADQTQAEPAPELPVGQYMAEALYMSAASIGMSRESVDQNVNYKFHKTPAEMTQEEMNFFLNWFGKRANQGAAS